VLLSELPLPVAQFLDALAAGDWDAAAGQCEPGARLLMDRDPASTHISSWAAGLVSDGPLLQRSLVVTQRAEAVVVVTLIPQAFGPLLLDAPQEFEWCFSLEAGRIRRLTVQPRSPPKLPGAVANFLLALNLLDLSALMTTFVPDARLVVCGREYCGHHAIRGWADLRVIGRRLTACVQEVQALPPHRTRARCLCDGDFDRHGGADAVIAEFEFRLRGACIDELVVEPLDGAWL
jgi:hypothetical protein